MDAQYVQLPAEAAKSISYALRREANRLLYCSGKPSKRDIRHANVLLVYADLIHPKQRAS